MNRLTPEALDALLAEHYSQNDDKPPSQQRVNPWCMSDDHVEDQGWPCTIYLLASEVRDAQQWLRKHAEHTESPDGQICLRYITEGSGSADYPCICSLNDLRALAHYEEGTK